MEVNENELNKEALILKIQKILALANGTNHTGEMDSAKRKAAELMAQYTISMSEVLNTKASHDDAFVREDIWGSDKKKVNWESVLAGGCARAFDCQVVNTWKSNGSYTNDWALAFMGTKSDLELSIHFFKFLRRTVGMMSDKFSTYKSERTTYAYGLAQELGSRLADIYRIRNEISADCRALVVVKHDGVEKFKHKEFPNLTTSYVNLRGSRSSLEQGRLDAHKVSLHRPISSGGPAPHRISN